MISVHKNDEIRSVFIRMLSQKMLKNQKIQHVHLSSLPDDILIRIMCLTKSYKCAIQCSAISKRWKDLYKKLPSLYFYEQEFSNLIDEEKRAALVTNYICTAIHGHQVPVHTFFLDTLQGVEYWDWCIRHFTDGNVRHLTLISRTQQPEPIPDCILSCTSLVTLRLVYSETSYIPFSNSPLGYPNLRECELCLLADSNQLEWLHHMLSKSPLLKSLTLRLRFCKDSEEIYDRALTFSSDSLLAFDVGLHWVGKPLQIIVMASELLKMKLCYESHHHSEESEESEEEDVPNINVVMVKAFKLSEISIPKNKEFVSLDFQGYREAPEIFERISYAKFQGFPHLYSCEMNLFGVTHCTTVAKWINFLLRNCPSICYLTMLLCFKKADGGKEEGYGMPLSFSSRSLLDLNIEVKYPRKKVQIKVAAPNLQKLILICNNNKNSSQKVQLQVKTPRLLEISVPQTTCDMLGSLETIEGIVNAKSNISRHHWVYLNFNHGLKSHINRDCQIFHLVSQLWKIKFLELSKICAYPTDIWSKLLTNLTLLEKLVFVNCIFKSEQNTASSCVKECEMSELQEIKFIDEAYNGLDGENELLSILLKNTPNLQLLSFALQKKKREYKDDYVALLGGLLLPGDMLVLNETSEEVECKISKRSI